MKFQQCRIQINNFRMQFTGTILATWIMKTSWAFALQKLAYEIWTPSIILIGLKTMKMLILKTRTKRFQVYRFRAGVAPSKFSVTPPTKKIYPHWIYQLVKNTHVNHIYAKAYWSTLFHKKISLLDRDSQR